MNYEKKTLMCLLIDCTSKKKDMTVFMEGDVLEEKLIQDDENFNEIKERLLAYRKGIRGFSFQYHKLNV